MLLGYIDVGTGQAIASSGAWLLPFLLGFLGFFWRQIKFIIQFFKYKNRWIWVLIVLVLSGLSFLVWYRNQTMSEFNRRIIILGFDGLSPTILERMMEEGKLPNYSALKKMGSYQHLATTNPPQSPVAWAGFITGKNPGKHGVFDFIHRDPLAYKLNLSLTQFEQGKPKNPIQAKPFWSYTTERKIPVTVLSCPVTFPAEQLDGRMLSGMGTPDILGTEGTFTFYTTEALPKDREIGGKTFSVRRNQSMVMHLIGPRIQKGSETTDHIKVPFKADIVPDGLSIEYQKKAVDLSVGQWSEWQEVEFKTGLFKKVKGIFKFFLAETEPELKLYISPINMDPREPVYAITYPRNYGRELFAKLGHFYTMGMPMDTWAMNEHRLDEQAFIDQASMVIQERTAMLDYELKRFDRGVLFTYFESPDIIQHMFWRLTDSDHPMYDERLAQEFGDTIERWYVKTDRVLGNVLTQLKEDDQLFVLSDHGFDTFRRAVHLNSWLREQGYLVLKNPFAESGAELMTDVDWSKTQAYAVGFGSIYINQQGREGQGIVQPGAETQNLKREIADKLMTWVDPQNSAPMIHHVYQREDIYWGDQDQLTPDLVVGYKTGYRASWQTALGGSPRVLVEDNLKKWSGSHLFDPGLVPGILLTNQTSVRENASIYDVTPTILKTIGLTDEELKAQGFDGSPLY